MIGERVANEGSGTRPGTVVLFTAAVVLAVAVWAVPSVGTS